MTKYTTEISIVWNYDDVQDVADSSFDTTLTDEQVGKVLDNLDKWHDAEFGIGWSNLEEAITLVLKEDKD